MTLGASPIAKRILRLAKSQGMLRAQDLKSRGLPVSYLWHLERAGQLKRLDRGLYALVDQPFSEHLSELEVAKRVPDGVLCLLSALNFHDLTVEYAHEVWLAIRPGRHHTRMKHAKVRYVHLSGKSLTEGIETHKVDGMELKVYCAAKTVADCFKFRHLIGMDVAMQALKQGLRERRFSPAELDHFARINRVSRVMQPYIEILIA